MDTCPPDTCPLCTCPLCTCPLCALPHAAGDLAWSSQHETDGTITWICPTCTRAQLWLIEAGLTIATATAPAAARPHAA